MIATRKMRTINVDIVLSLHPLWKSIVKYPPANVKYRIFKPTFYTKILFRVANFIPNMLNPVHFCNGAKPLRRKPWVVDLESVKVFFKRYSDMENSDKINEICTLLEGEACRKILPLTNFALQTVKKHLKINKNKMDIIYPAIKFLRKTPQIRIKEPLNILFIGGAFDAKGGREVLIAFKEIARGRNVKLIIVGGYREEYKNWVRGLNVEWHKHLMRRTLLKEYYPKADIFIMPSFMDTIGYVLLEAMAFGIPVVTSNHAGIKEIVGDAGITVQIPIGIWNADYTYNPNFMQQLYSVPYFEETAEQLADVLHILLDDPELRERLGRRGLKRVKSGPLSIKVRNEKLRRVYGEAFGQ